MELTKEQLAELEKEGLELAIKYLKDNGFIGHLNHSLCKNWMAEFYRLGATSPFVQNLIEQEKIKFAISVLIEIATEYQNNLSIGVACLDKVEKLEKQLKIK